MPSITEEPKFTRHEATVKQRASRSEVSPSRGGGDGARENGLDGLAEFINGERLRKHRTAGISQYAPVGIAVFGVGEYDPLRKFGAILLNPLIEPGGRDFAGQIDVRYHDIH